MRPRHKAAENHLALGHELRILRSASMRPRHKAAENRIVYEPSARRLVSLQ